MYLFCGLCVFRVSFNQLTPPKWPKFYNHNWIDTFILVIDSHVIMTPLKDFEGDLVRDLLTKGQVHWIQEQKKIGKIQLIELNDFQGSFAGFFPMNAPLRDGLIVKLLENGDMSPCPIVTGG